MSLAFMVYLLPRGVFLHGICHTGPPSPSKGRELPTAQPYRGFHAGRAEWVPARPDGPRRVPPRTLHRIGRNAGNAKTPGTLVAGVLPTSSLGWLYQPAGLRISPA